MLALDSADVAWFGHLDDFDGHEDHLPFGVPNELSELILATTRQVRKEACARALAGSLDLVYAANMSGSTPEITDLATLKALANPVRLGLYELLVANGPTTTMSLADQAGVASGSVTYHLRVLASHGFVEAVESPGGDRRTSTWRAVPGGITWSRRQFEVNGAAQDVLDVAEQTLIDRRLERLRGWLASDLRHAGGAWSDAALSTDVLMHLTPSELKELGQELQDVLDRWVRKGGRAGESASDHSPDGTEERAAVVLFLQAFPRVDQQPGQHRGQDPHDSLHAVD